MPSATLQTFRDPAFSLWQSAVHSTLFRSPTQNTLALP
jgi:hypothetical protein